MTTRRAFIAAAGMLVCSPALAHHGWSSFDTRRPVYLEGRVTSVSWRNPHAEFDLDVGGDLKLPPDLSRRALPPQAAPVDGAALLASAELPRRRDRIWKIELAPLSRLRAWGVPELKPGDEVAVLGYTFADEKGEALLRVEYLFARGQVYGLRSSPA
jgi:hypothetical protein